MSLNALASVLAGGQAAVGVDTGLVHLAVALRLPTVAIYTDTDPGLTGIYPGTGVPAINLGGKADAPSADRVIEAMTGILGR